MIMTDRRTLPIKLKHEMVDEVAQIVVSLHTGDKKRCEKLMEELKVNALYLDEEIQHNVLIFTGQIDFQKIYDPWHRISPEVERSALFLIGLLQPSFEAPLASSF
jgi:hypothetical protein